MMRRPAWMDETLQESRRAARRLLHAPVFTITVVLTLALGIGATTAVFSLIDAVMLRSLPVADPSQLYQIGAGIGRSHGILQGDWGTFSYSLYKDIAASTPQFQAVAAFQDHAGVLSVREASAGSQAQALMGEYVSGNYFPVFGLSPHLGRLLKPDDDRRSAPPVAVLSYGSWIRTYHADPRILGSSVAIEEHPFTIVGVAPRGFFGDTLSSTPPEIWIPLSAEYITDGKDAFNLIPSQPWLHLVGRLRPGAALAGTAAGLTATLHHWLMTDADLPPADLPRSAAELDRQLIRLAPAGSGIGVMRRAYASSLHLLFGLCCSVLLIACANVATLLLARGASMRPQLSLQLALGAARSTILRQRLLECLLLAATGGALGVATGWCGARLLIDLLFHHSSALPVQVAPSLPVLLFCVALSLLTALIFGTVPAWIASRVDPAEALRGTGRLTSSGDTRPQQLMLVVQASIAVLLAAASGMLAHSLRQLQDQDLGFHPEHRLVLTMEPPLARYSLPQLTVLYRQLLERLSAIPGVRSASLALAGPTSPGWREVIVQPGQAPSDPGSFSIAAWNRVSPGYFHTTGIPLLQGRDFNTGDRVDTPGVAIVNQAFVRKFLHGRAPLGQHFGLKLQQNADALRIIGVVGDAKSGDLREPPQPMAFGALAQRFLYPDATLQASDKWEHFINGAQVLYTGEAGTLIPKVREVFREVDPNFAIVSIQPLQEQVNAQLSQQVTVANLSSLFALLALLLAAVGFYGVTSRMVAQRTYEMGVRIALGARRRLIVSLVLRHTAAPMAIGAASGVLLAIAAGAILSSMLYRVGAVDPLSLAASIAALLLATTLAGIPPALRAASIDPAQTLRKG